MLEKYKDEQTKVYKILKNQIDGNKLAHAYLFISNNYSNTVDLIESFIFDVVSTQKGLDLENIKYRIENKMFSDLTIIEPDGQFIKKDQIEKLQHEFQNTALENEKKFYILKDADKLNKSSANTLLKFLEEPEENIMAFLVTNHKNLMLETIVSRCVNINLLGNVVYSDDVALNIANTVFLDKSSREEFISNESSVEKIEKALKFINYYEANGMETIIHLNSLFHSIFTEKSDVILAFDIMILYYGDILNRIIGRNIVIFRKSIREIDKIIVKNDSIKIGNKINVLIDAKNKVRDNANIKLLLDKLVFELEEV